MITPVSSALWKSSGRVYCHSREDDIWGLAITPRWAEKASHRRKINRIKARNETIDPTEDTTFHLVIASG